MQRPTTTARFSDEHHISFPEDSFDDDDVSDGHPLYKQHSQSVMPERLIHFIPMSLILCLLSLWLFSHPVDLVVKNGSTGVQENETVPAMLDHPLVDFFLLKPVSASLAPAPQNQTAIPGTSMQEYISSLPMELWNCDETSHYPAGDNNSLQPYGSHYRAKVSVFGRNV